ncbi:TRAP transporter small permease [Chloroflexota bacterium]
MKVFGAIIHAVNVVAVVVLAAMMLLTTADVFLRYTVSKPITGVTEITEWMMVTLGFLALSWTAYKRGHLKVDLVMTRFSPRVQGIADSITLFLGLLGYIIITWRGFVAGISALEQGMTKSLYYIPIGPFYFVLATGTGLFCATIVPILVEHIKKAVKG